MNRSASLPLKIVYCLTLLSAIVPIGLASSGWVRLTTGGGSPWAVIPYVGPLLFLAVGLYRIYLVARVPGTLDMRRVEGIAAMLRILGTIGLYLGAVVGLLSWFGVPLTRMIFPRSSGTGVEFYLVGLYLAMAGGIGVMGLLLFELSRLMGFERQAREEPS